MEAIGKRLSVAKLRFLMYIIFQNGNENSVPFVTGLSFVYGCKHMQNQKKQSAHYQLPHASNISPRVLSVVLNLTLNYNGICFDTTGGNWNDL